MIEAVRLGWGRRIGYAVGDLGFNVYWQGVGLFLYFFYTDVMGISPLWAGVAYAVASVWDGISDPIMGAIADRTRTRWGKFRPYLLLGAVPCALFFALSFWAPPLSGAWLVVYATLTHVALRTFYTVMSIPYIALTARMTGDAGERSTLAGMRMVFAATGGLSIAFGFPQLVEAFGGDPRTAWFKTAAVLSVAATVIFVVCFLATREVIADDEEGMDPHRALAHGLRVFRKDVVLFWSMLRHNEALLRVFLAISVISVALSMFSKCILYWFKYGLERPDLAKYALPLPALALILMVPVWVTVAKRTSKRTAWLAGSVVAASGYLAFFLNPSSSFGVTLALMAWISVGASAFAVMFWAMLPDTVEFNEWKVGERAEARIFGFASFAQKIALGVNALLLGQILQAIGFVANQEQSAGSILGIKAVMTLIPLAGVIATVLILWRYPITAAFHARMREEIAARSAGPSSERPA